MTISIDLLPLKAQLETSAASFSSMAEKLRPQLTTAVSGVLPQAVTLQSGLVDASLSLAESAKSLGTSVTGFSVSSLPTIESLVKKLSPDMKGLAEVARSVTAQTVFPEVSSLAGIEKISAIATSAVAETESVTTVAVQTQAQISSEQQSGPPTLPAMLAEIETLYATLANYQEGLAAYLFSPTTELPPQLDIGDLVTDQLNQVLVNNKDAAVDTVASALQKAVVEAASIAREVGFREMTKPMLYDLAQTESLNLGLELRAESGKLSAELRSMIPSQLGGQ
jgi:hypothetical protein